MYVLHTYNMICVYIYITLYINKCTHTYMIYAQCMGFAKALQVRTLRRVNMVRDSSLPDQVTRRFIDVMCGSS